MYDELVRELRTGYCEPTLLDKAADAIEERDRYALTLQHEMMAEAESHIALVERLNKQIKELSKSRWISVTERLTDAYEDVLLKFPNNQAAGFVDRDGCWGVYSGDGFYTEVADNEPKPTHWAKKLPEPPKGEET